MRVTVTFDVDGAEPVSVQSQAQPVAETIPVAKSDEHLQWLEALNFNLTNREIDVLKLAATGMQYKQIALILGLSERTIRTHMENIYKKTGLQSNTMLVSWAWLTGLVDVAVVLAAWRQIAPHLMQTDVERP